jgi:putative CocE/NonD family hydrolase
MSDGTRLAAKIWLPKDAEINPVPAILEYIPYRKRDMVADRDATIHPYFAGHGYASLRVDIRGSGDSEGVLEDEYLAQEQKDGLEILRWIASQPWSDGSVGMMGISWGGFNSLQLAALQPPELKAIITVCSTDDRYADDVHYMGGCLLGDNLSWASTMFAFNSLPPDPELVGDAWREMWFKRLEGSGLWLKKWLSHQRRDDFWKHGSVCEDYSSIKCPVMAVSGWADGYSNAVFRLLSSLEVPRKGLVGPWSHKYPHLGVPGPAIGFLQEAVRWWDTWLKGEDRGVEEEPMLRAWMQDSVSPFPSYAHRPGRWVAEQNWPSANISEQCFKMAPGRLLAEDVQVQQEPMQIQSPLDVGLFAGKWCSYAAAPDLPHDQRQEDGGALVLESAVLEEDLEILGAPVLDLEVSSNQPVAMIAVRLSDVGEDDSATRVTYGLLNLTHRDSHEHPRDLEPDKVYRVQVRLNEVAQNFPAGHRLRISISTSYWPLAWPPPKPVKLSIWAGKSSLILPVRPVNEIDQQLRILGEAEGAPPLRRNMLEPERHNWWVKRDLAKDESVLEVTNDEGVFRLEHIDLEAEMKAKEWYTFQGNDFDSLKGETRWQCALKRGDWSVRTITRTVLTSDATHFRLRAEMDAYEGDFRVWAKDWDYSIARDKL